MKRTGSFKWSRGAVFLALVLEVSCSTSGHSTPRNKHASLEQRPLGKLLQQVDASDGIDQTEARLLSDAYFNKFEGCGGAELESRTSREWIFRTRVGYAGVAVTPIKVDNRSGVIRQKGQKTIEPPWDELANHLKTLKE
jgi:hypothetical protein